MFFPAFVLSLLFLLLSAFFPSSEGSFIAASPFKLDFLKKKASKRAILFKKMLKKVDSLLPMVSIGNTLVNIAVASLANFIFVSFIPKKNQAVLSAIVVTTFLILILSGGFPRFRAYRGKRGNREGVIHTEDINPYLVDNKENELTSFLRKPLFLTESASLNRALLQCRRPQITSFLSWMNSGVWKGL